MDEVTMRLTKLDGSYHDWLTFTNNLLNPSSDLPPLWFNTLRPRQNGRHVADDTFKCIFINENVRILINISLKFVPKGLINNILALIQILAWRRPGDKPSSEPMMVNLLTHICVTRPQWVKAQLRTLIHWCHWCHGIDTDLQWCVALLNNTVN